MPILLEIAVASVDDVGSAEAGGANRLELNTALDLGGLTPSLAALIESKNVTPLPIMAMVRPRSGGFAYSDADFRVMQRDIDLFLERGASGIVFGILTDDGRIDMDRCRRLVKQIGACEAVFHRAFDVTPDPFVALEQLIDLGLKRVMTSGQEETAYKGASLISELIDRAEGRIEVLPTGGINRITAAELVARTGCKQVHASMRTQRQDRSVLSRPLISFSGAVKVPEYCYPATDATAVSELRRILDSLT